MSRLMRFPTATRRDRAVGAWMRAHDDVLGQTARRWFEVMRSCGDDVRELLHDGHPTACVGDSAFANVNAFSAHVNLGFFLGALFADPDGLLEGAGRFMRHVKLGPGRPLDEAALRRLIEVAYHDMQRRVGAPKLAASEAFVDTGESPSGTQGPTPQSETFHAELRTGHKDCAAEVPFDPGARWTIAAQALRPGRRGFRVRAKLNDTVFETAIVARSRKFWLLVPARIAQTAAVSIGESARFAVSPLSASDASS